jgi:hypothetical protein
VVLSQVVLKVSVAQRSDRMKRHGILVRSKPVAFFDEAHCRNAKTGISRTPLCYLPQELWITHEIRGPIETHRLFYLGRVTQIESRRLQLAAQAYVIYIGQDD